MVCHPTLLVTERPDTSTSNSLERFNKLESLPVYVKATTLKPHLTMDKRVIA